MNSGYLALKGISSRLRGPSCRL